MWSHTLERDSLPLRETEREGYTFSNKAFRKPLLNPDTDVFQFKKMSKQSSKPS
jgi:hypothetical protein